MNKKEKAGEAYVRLQVNRDLLRQFKIACVANDVSMTQVLEAFMKNFAENSAKQS